MQITGLVLHLRKGASKFRVCFLKLQGTKVDPTADYLKQVVISKYFN